LHIGISRYIKYIYWYIRFLFIMYNSNKYYKYNRCLYWLLYFLRILIIYFFHYYYKKNLCTILTHKFSHYNYYILYTGIGKKHKHKGIYKYILLRWTFLIDKQSNKIVKKYVYFTEFIYLIFILIIYLLYRCNLYTYNNHNIII